MASEKKKRRSISTFAILLAVMLLVSAATWLTSGQSYTDGETGETVAVAGASLSDIVMAPINGWHDAGDVIGFVFCLGAFLSILTATGALETGIHVLVKKLKGKEMVLIWILMFLFSIGGTTYGMGEETVGFYILLAATMMAAGFDPMVGAATVLLGAGTGVIGSTVNPFATGAAVAAAVDSGVTVNMTVVYVEAGILWIGTYVIAALFVTKYAKGIQSGKGSILTSEQIAECRAAYGGATEIDDGVKLSGRQKVVLVLFALSFLIMILGFIPWGSLHEGIYNALSPTSFLTGSGLGDWWFDDAATWFLLMGVIIGVIGLEEAGVLRHRRLCRHDQRQPGYRAGPRHHSDHVHHGHGYLAGGGLRYRSVLLRSARPHFRLFGLCAPCGAELLGAVLLGSGHAVRPHRLPHCGGDGLVCGDLHHDQRGRQRLCEPVYPHLRLHHGRSGLGPRALGTLGQMGRQAAGNHRRAGGGCAHRGYDDSELRIPPFYLFSC